MQTNLGKPLVGLVKLGTSIGTRKVDSVSKVRRKKKSGLYFLIVVYS